jgi:hypothetical protein
MRRQGPHDGQAPALGRIHPRQVCEGPAHPHLGTHGILVAQLQAKVPQPGLRLLDEPSQGHGGAHVGQGIVRRLVRQPVGGGQVFQSE